MRVLVTGGSGYLGQAIVRALLARGHEVVVFGRKTTSEVDSTLETASRPQRSSWIRGDVRDRDVFVAAARGADALIHTAALVAVWRPRAADFDEVNVGGLRHALEAVRTHGLQRVVYTSSFLALPPAGRRQPLRSNDYQRTKTLADRLARDAQDGGAPIVRMYPGVIYGPGLMSEGNLVGRQIADHLAGRLPGLIGADRIWSFSWVDAVASAHVAALEHPSPAPEYRVGGPNEPQIRPFEILRELTGVRLPTRLPPWAGHVAAFVDPARAALLGKPRQITHETVEIFRHDWPLDSDAAERDLDYRPTPLSAGVAAIANTVTGST